MKCRNEIVVVGVIFMASIALQYAFNFCFKKEFISTLLTVFALFFGFYITSFSVFASSQYLSVLYDIQDKDDNRLTLLHVLLNKFERATLVLLISTLALVCLYILMENELIKLVNLFAYFLWGIVLANFFYLFRSISVLTQITINSAKTNKLPR